MMTEAILKMTAQLERSKAWYRGQSVRHVVCELEAPKLVRESDEPETRVHLALVLDNSGSMSGAPLQAAKETALAVVELLGAEDVLTVVTFSSEIEVVLEPVEMNSKGKKLAREQISQVQTTGLTNLSGGWFEGATQISQDMDEYDEHVHHLILLSDGHANQGLLDLERLCSHVAQTRERGMSTSCVGFGDNYEMNWLESIADAGGGRLHDAEHPEEIAEVLLGELGEVRKTVLEDVRLGLTAPEGVQVELLGRSATLSTGKGLDAIVGSLISEAQRKLVFVLKLSSGDIGSTVSVRVQASYKLVGEAEPRLSRAIPLQIELVRGPENNHQTRNVRLAQLIARHWQLEALHRCMQLNRDYAYKQATDYANEQLELLTRFCRQIPETETLLEELRLVAERASYEISERSRKNVQMKMRQGLVGSTDHRVSRCIDTSILQELNIADFIARKRSNQKLEAEDN
jgi:Ca-activated chloride channel family protein